MSDRLNNRRRRLEQCSWTVPGQLRARNRLHHYQGGCQNAILRRYTYPPNGNRPTRSSSEAQRLARVPQTDLRPVGVEAALAGGRGDGGRLLRSVTPPPLLLALCLLQLLSGQSTRLPLLLQLAAQLRLHLSERGSRSDRLREFRHSQIQTYRGRREQKFSSSMDDAK